MVYLSACCRVRASTPSMRPCSASRGIRSGDAQRLGSADRAIHQVRAPLSHRMRYRLPRKDRIGRSTIRRMSCGRSNATTHQCRRAAGGYPCHRQPRPDHPSSPRQRWNVDLRVHVADRDPNTIAETTGICTVADFRRRDVAAGGQGAPLVPAFHLWAFGSDTRERVIVNIGGMANISVLRPSSVHGFDTGPGNALLDGWNRRHGRGDYDRDGYFGPFRQRRLPTYRALARHPPARSKSTGREEFNLAWLDGLLNGLDVAARDVQATLLTFTAATIANAILDTLPESGEVFVCGGGIHNACLMEQLRKRLQPRQVESTAALGIEPDWVEAGLFAWLARQTLSGRPGNLPSVTGAGHAVVLGAIHLGRNRPRSD